MNLSMVPAAAVTIFSQSPYHLPTVRATSSGGSDSESLVKPLMSETRTIAGTVLTSAMVRMLSRPASAMVV